MKRSILAVACLAIALTLSACDRCGWNKKAVSAQECDSGDCGKDATHLDGHTQYTDQGIAPVPGKMGAPATAPLPEPPAKRAKRPAVKPQPSAPEKPEIAPQPEPDVSEPEPDAATTPVPPPATPETPPECDCLDFECQGNAGETGDCAGMRRQKAR